MSGGVTGASKGIGAAVAKLFAAEKQGADAVSKAVQQINADLAAQHVVGLLRVVIRRGDLRIAIDAAFPVIHVREQITAIAESLDRRSIGRALRAYSHSKTNSSSPSIRNW